MDESRALRYRAKINYIVDNIKDLPFEPENEFEKKGILYSLQTSIESTIDLVAMLVKDLGIEVKDDNTNITVLSNKKQLSARMESQLKKANGMRNLIVHRYNSFDEKIVLDSVKDVKALLFEWLDVVEEILSEFINN